MYKGREPFDNVAWDRNDEKWEESQKHIRLKSTCRIVESLVEEKLGKPATLIPPLIIGGYNILYRIHLDGAADVMVRMPCPSLAEFPDEKTIYEVATAKYIKQNTQVPIPQLFHHGRDPKIGPFIILEYVEHQWDLSDALTIPNQHSDLPPILNHNLSDTTLESLYSKIACYLLQLSQLSFPFIGSLVENKEDTSLLAANGCTYSITGRPITQNMNNMIQLANIPRVVLPPEGMIYTTSDQWYVKLAEMHISQLVFQHNDLISSEDDCKNKFVARQLFHALAKQGRLSTFGFAEDKWSAQSNTQALSLSPAPSGSDSFRLWCDDFRPTNVLLNVHNEGIAVIDWEFAYSGPTQFVLDPPWWLLLDVPEMWSPGIDNWSKVYSTRLKTWLSAMKQAEKNTGDSSLQLSTHMKQSWETGRFWLNYSARKSWAFDTIFWKYLDERFFGTRSNVPTHDLWKTRIHLLGEKERSAMGPFVLWKMEESKQRILVEWDAKEARERLAEVLFS